MLFDKRPETVGTHPVLKHVGNTIRSNGGTGQSINFVFGCTDPLDDVQLHFTGVGVIDILADPLFFPIFVYDFTTQARYAHFKALKILN